MAIVMVVEVGPGRVIVVAKTKISKAIFFLKKNPPKGAYYP
jgi:hypothetical protein